MAHPYHHAQSSAKRWGGTAEDYLAVHEWFDETKAHHADFRHRALRHHAEGIFLCQQIFGVTLTSSDGRAIPIRWVGEQHVKEDILDVSESGFYAWGTRPSSERAIRRVLSPGGVMLRGAVVDRGHLPRR